MMQPKWQLAMNISAIIFDCDSTLSSIEGIDELAETKNVQQEVSRLTELAMNKTGINPLQETTEPSRTHKRSSPSSWQNLL